MSEIVRTESGGALAEMQHVEPMDRLLNAIVSNSISPENATAAYSLYRSMLEDRAKQTFAESFADLQIALPVIVAKQVIPNKDGTVRSTFASFKDIVDGITPCLREHGFMMRFDSETTDKTITAVCVLTHKSGHTVTSKFGVHISSIPAASAAQADTGALTTAKRGAMCNMFGIAVSHDDDARMLGDFITEGQAESLRKRLEATGGDVVAFFKVADAPKGEFGKIRTGKYSMLDAALLRKEAKQKA